MAQGDNPSSRSRPFAPRPRRPPVLRRPVVGSCAAAWPDLPPPEALVVEGGPVFIFLISGPHGPAHHFLTTTRVLTPRYSALSPSSSFCGTPQIILARKRTSAASGGTPTRSGQFKPSGPGAMRGCPGTPGGGALQRGGWGPPVLRGAGTPASVLRAWMPVPIGDCLLLLVYSQEAAIKAPRMGIVLTPKRSGGSKHEGCRNLNLSPKRRVAWAVLSPCQPVAD